MYLHIGNDIVVPYKDIIAILNLETSGKASTTREFFDKNHIPKKAPNLSGIKSCVITDREVLYSTISSGTLLKRTSIPLYE